MKRIINLIASSSLVFAMFVGLAVAAVTFSPDVALANNVGEVRDGVDAIGGNQAGNTGADFSKLLEDVINILLFIIGAVAVIMIIVGGIRYTTSGGDQASVTSAKNTILYSIVGLVVAIMAYAIVNWVLNGLN
ncbi:TPA: hypothetical protein DCF80_02620 [Candidatus Saccharibacteria bacterium]|nr:hypothetical protein [Candidatus Saccharibacteria bacterium]HRK40575.1 TrbC/VirB2 family protein [Candidatus Saccharibacteria bacterium]